MNSPLKHINQAFSKQAHVVIDSPQLELYHLFQTALTRCSDRMVQATQDFSTRIPPEVKTACPHRHTFSDREQTILVYYRPFAGQIRADPDLGARCLSAILQQPVRLRSVAPFMEKMEPTTILALDKVQLNTSAVWGGSRPVDVPCFDIRIGPLAPDQILGFLPGAPLRRFIDLGLCPLFLSAKARWIIGIEAKEEEEATVGFWGINTYVH